MSTRYWQGPNSADFYEEVERRIAALPWWRRVWVKYIGSVNYEALGLYRDAEQPTELNGALCASLSRGDKITLDGKRYTVASVSGDNQQAKLVPGFVDLP